MNIRPSVIALLLTALLGAAAASTEQHVRLIVIVPATQTITGVTSADLRRIYLGDMTRWPDGRRIVPVMLRPGSIDTDTLLKHFLRIAPIDFAQQWISAVFRGRVAAPPVTVATSDDAMRFVATHPESIAIIVDRADVLPAVRIFRIDGRLRDDARYQLFW
jgi:hypothetical protein